MATCGPVLSAASPVVWAAIGEMAITHSASTRPRSRGSAVRWTIDCRSATRLPPHQPTTNTAIRPTAHCASSAVAITAAPSAAAVATTRRAVGACCVLANAPARPPAASAQSSLP